LCDVTRTTVDILKDNNCQSVAAPAIDRVGPRPCHFRLGPTLGPTTWPRSQNSKTKIPTETWSSAAE